MSAPRLAGRVAIVTGGAAGIGRAVCLRFAEEGATVIVGDVDLAGARRTVDLMGEVRADSRAVGLDVVDEGSWQAAVEEVRSQHGRLDVLVNNAGLPCRAVLADSSWSQWEHLMAVNAGGQFLGIKHCATLLAEGDGGSIVTMSSAAALVGVAGMTSYSATKGAVRAMSRAAAAELAPMGVRVNAVHPTSVHTAMLESDARDSGVPVEDFATGAASLSPLAGLASVDDVANAVLFLAGPESAFITGAELPVDGGATSLVG